MVRDFEQNDVDKVQVLDKVTRAEDFYVIISQEEGVGLWTNPFPTPAPTFRLDAIPRAVLSQISGISTCS